MDINSLLSPAESPADETPPTAPVSNRSSPVRRQPRPSIQQKRSSSLSQQYSQSPHSGEQSLPSFAAHNAAYQNQHAMYGQPSPTRGAHAPINFGSDTSTPPPTVPTSDPRHAIQRHGSTPQMDTLADLASMQHTQHASPRPSLPSREITTSQSYTLQNLLRPPLSARSSNEIVMTDPNTQERRTYRSQALLEDECRALNELGNHLVTNPFDYSSHVQFVTLLQRGFAVHVSGGLNPHEYELLHELRDARRQMDQFFPLGESLWVSWLNDEMALVANVDERLRLMELFARSVADEPSSVRLWRKYGDYTYYLWATAYGFQEPPASTSWTTKDLQLGKEYFKWGPMLRIWEEGVAHTHFRLNDSHQVWDQYIQVLVQDHDNWPDKQKLVNIEQKFAERLAEAHATWENTYQNFGQFLSTHDAKNYEDIMAQMSRNRGAQTAWRIREKFENAILQAADNGDESKEYEAYTDYLSWELSKKGIFSFRMINSLYERATVRFPSVQSFWIDYIDFIINEPSSKEVPVMPIIERATRHCPWSGDLWAHKLLTMEAEGRPFSEIENIKHRATATGLLDVGGMEELMKVYVAWCGGLRRRAFAPGASEDELDIAEVAIRSALEHVKKIGHDKYGNKYAGDPHYRLERIYIKFMMQKGEVDIARDSWKDIMRDQFSSYDFWYRYYMWEMVIWAKFSVRGAIEPETQLRCPELATAVLKEALEHVDTMDWPEQLVPMYLSHCEHHESVDELRRAVIKTREVNRQITRRREKEAAAATLAHEEAQNAQATPVSVDQTLVNGKRKREHEETTPEETSAKKTKSDEPELKDHSLPVASQVKRDREHTTIIVEHIPSKATEGQIRHFFRDCGEIKSLTVVDEKNSQTATIEFESQEEAAYSISKSGKTFQGVELNVKFGTGCTVFVTNYPPEADKEYLEDLFAGCGEIVDVRMPSLKANTKRRFAYVQFLDPDSALKATQLNDKKLEGKYKLVAAISDPNKAGNREGAQAEGREVFVGNVYWYIKEDELKTLLESAGEIVSLRIPRNIEGKSKGSAFVVFKTKQGAEKAVQEYNDFDFKGRRLHVEVSSKKASRTATNIHRGSTMSPTPETAESPSVTGGIANGVRSAAGSTTGDPEPGARNHKERTIALMNVPDTVTAARLEKLVEQFGTIKKFTLRPDHAGAIVEYAVISSVGKAQLALEEYELEDHKLHVGTVPELMKQHPEDKTQTTTTAKKSKKEEKGDKKKAFSAPVQRPAQNNRGGARGGRRGGLGFTARTAANTTTSAIEGVAAEPKSNDYFRDLMAGKVAAKKDTTEAARIERKEEQEGGNDDLLDDIMGGDDEPEADAPAAGNGDELLDDLMD